MNPKTHKKRVLSSDEEDFASKDDKKEIVNTPRSSQRLRSRSERKSFVLPSRDEIWDRIPSDLSPNKRLSTIKGRKTVNDFTKVYNTYNYDDYEDTSDDESEGFITESSENDQISEEEKQNARLKTGRVRNFKRRIILCSSSDDDSEVLSPKTSSTEHKVDNGCDLQKSATDDSLPVQSEQGKCEGSESLEDKITASEMCLNTNSSNVNDSDSDEVSPAKRRRNTSVLELESDSSDALDNAECETMTMPSNEVNVSDSNKISHPTSAGNDITPLVVSSEYPSNTNNPSTDNIIEIVSSEEDESNSWEYCTDTDSSDDVTDRSAKFKRKKEKLFKKFKDIQRVKKNSKVSQTSTS